MDRQTQLAELEAAANDVRIVVQRVVVDAEQDVPCLRLELEGGRALTLRVGPAGVRVATRDEFHGPRPQKVYESFQAAFVREIPQLPCCYGAGRQCRAGRRGPRAPRAQCGQPALGQPLSSLGTQAPIPTPTPPPTPPHLSLTLRGSRTSERSSEDGSGAVGQGNAAWKAGAAQAGPASPLSHFAGLTYLRTVLRGWHRRVRAGVCSVEGWRGSGGSGGRRVVGADVFELAGELVKGHGG